METELLIGVPDRRYGTRKNSESPKISEVFSGAVTSEQE
jgi:hypothetical protein